MIICLVIEWPGGGLPNLEALIGVFSMVLAQLPIAWVHSVLVLVLTIITILERVDWSDCWRLMK